MNTTEADPLALTRPRYGAASLADVLPSVLAVLGVPGMADPLDLRAILDGVRRVAVLLVDGLGHLLLPLAAPHAPHLADLASGRLGAARAITAGFPSTTPVSLVTLGTGAVPGAHGVLGFSLNVPGTDQVLNHLEWREEPDPFLWQPVRTRFEQAAAAGVAVTSVTRPEFAGSGLTIAANRGARLHPGTDARTVAAGMLAALIAGDGPTLVYGYLPDVDRAGHIAGVDSPLWREAVVEVDRLLDMLVASLPEDAALLVTADHGQLNVPEQHRFDCDCDPRLRAGVAVVAGESRVRYLHTLPGATADVLAAWRGVLGDAAWVVTREEAVAQGWFGPVPEAHLTRIGDVVAACRGSYAVLASAHEPARVARHVGFHGSATAAEMAIPLLLAVSPRGPLASGCPPGVDATGPQAGR